MFLKCFYQSVFFIQLYVNFKIQKDTNKLHYESTVRCSKQVFETLKYLIIYQFAFNYHNEVGGKMHLSYDVASGSEITL